MIARKVPITGTTDGPQPELWIPPARDAGSLLVMRRRILLASVIADAVLAVLLLGCGGGTTTSTPNKPAPARQSSAPAWQPGTPAPKVTLALIGQAGHGLTEGNATLGTVDEVFGSVPANAHVNPSAKRLNDQYARFGRCMGEHMRIHDLGHELALLAAYNRRDHVVQADVEKASQVCTGAAITPDLRYRQSLKANP